MHSNTREEIKEVRAGDIAAAVGLKDVTTGDTMCDVSNVITLEKMEFPEPVISVAVEPKSTEDEAKMGIGLQKLAKASQTFIRKGERSNISEQYVCICSLRSNLQMKHIRTIRLHL